jgi:hypothetical protein
LHDSQRSSQRSRREFSPPLAVIVVVHHQILQIRISGVFASSDPGQPSLAWSAQDAARDFPLSGNLTSNLGETLPFGN